MYPPGPASSAGFPPQSRVSPTVASGFGNPGFGNPGFGGPGGPGFVPAPSNAGFAAINGPPSNPSFNSGQGYPPQPMGYPPQGIMAPGYPPSRPQGRGAGKVIAVITVLAIAGGGVAFAVASSSGSGSSNNGSTTVTPTPIATQPGGEHIHAPPTVPANVIQPIPPPADNNQVVMRPIETPQPLQPQPQPQPQPRADSDSPRPEREHREHAGVCQGGTGRIDDLILSGRCAAAQSVFRQMRAAGCSGRAVESFGTACPAP